MALTKIDDIFLYTALNETAHDCWLMKKYLQDNNINYTSLHYNDDTQLPSVFAPLNTWWQNVNFTEMPILIYTEIHDDLPPSKYPRKFFTNLEDIQASNFLQDYSLGRT